MKTNKLIVPLLTGVLFAAAANTRADVHITATGSTAFRNIAVDAIKKLYDGGSPASVGNVKDAAYGICYFGTVSNAVPSLGATIVQFHATFSGSAQGATDLYDHNLINVTYSDGNHSGTNGATEPSLAPDLSFSDNWPQAMATPILNSKYDNNGGIVGGPDIVGVNVFDWVVNTNLYQAGLTNITRETAKLLMTTSGNQDGTSAGMPANYIGGNNNNLIWLFGRDIGSGTRITTFATLGFAGQPTQYAVNSSGQIVLASDIAGQVFAISGNGISVSSAAWVRTNTTLGSPANGYALDGYDSGGNLVTVLNQTTNAIGYAGYPDSTSSGNGYHSASPNLLTFQGATPSPANVESGAYPFWSYEHLLSVGNVNGDANKQLIKAALLTTLTNATFQNTDANYYNNSNSPQAARLAAMLVQRSVDGGPITTSAAGTAVYGF
jgi:ABC-type phosphate transport system substrate-binding protein